MCSAEPDTIIAARNGSPLILGIGKNEHLVASDAAAGVTGQIFAVRGNEIFLMSQPRPLKSVHRSDGWTPETIAEHAMPALKSQFYDLERSADVFNWDPI